ncbi:MAG: magnesium transporter [Flavobacteriales bacterium]
MEIKLDKQYLKELHLNIQQENNIQIEQDIKELHWADIAEILDALNFHDAKYVFQLLDEEVASNILTELEEDIRERLLSELSSKEIADRYIENLDSDDAADLLGELSETKKDEVLSHIEDMDQAIDIVDLLSYDEETAGGLMAKEYIRVNKNWTVLQCIREMRKQAEDVDYVYSIYVVDDNDVLCGVLSLKTLLFANERSTITGLFNDKVISVKTNADQEEVVNIMKKYDLVALPVVDDISRLVGRITIDDAVDVLREEADKDYQMASGISEDVESDDSVFILTRARLPWLLVGMIGGILGAVVMDYFGIEENVELALFAPLIAAMGGNVGVQSAAIIVQGLAGNNLGHQTMFQRLKKETLVALINGFVCAVIVFFISFPLSNDWNFSKVLGLSLISVVVFAALFGTIVPLSLNRFKIDPALATGPFITTANDIFGLCIYFSLAKWLLA